MKKKIMLSAVIAGVVYIFTLGVFWVLPPPKNSPGSSLGGPAQTAERIPLNKALVTDSAGNEKLIDRPDSVQFHREVNEWIEAQPKEVQDGLRKALLKNSDN